ncbi:hypothetical protein TNCV_2325511 [Trichonephila clavipes]|nr:hypothetical protein TNCV_2325511 [Trichonephila clavipes]
MKTTLEQRADCNGPKTRNEYFKTARLLRFSRPVVFSVCVKWINDGETSSRHQAVGRPRIIKEKERRSQLTAQYTRRGPSTKFFGTRNSAITVGYGTALVCQALSTLTVGPGTSRLDRGLAEESSLVGRIMISYSSHPWSCQGASSS